MYQKEGNCIIPTLYLCSRLCVSEKGKLYHTIPNIKDKQLGSINNCEDVNSRDTENIGE
jgi:hypothetical protein